MFQMIIYYQNRPKATKSVTQKKSIKNNTKLGRQSNNYIC